MRTKYKYCCLIAISIGVAAFFFGVPLIVYLTKYGNYYSQRRWVSTGQCTTKLISTTPIPSGWYLILNISSPNLGIPTRRNTVSCIGLNITFNSCLTQNGVNQTQFCFFDRKNGEFGDYQEYLEDYQTTTPNLWEDLFETYVYIIAMFVGIIALVGLTICIGETKCPNQIRKISESVPLLYAHKNPVYK